MAQLTYGQFAAMVLAAMGAPITANNIDKLSAVGVQEGSHGKFNLMNWVRDAPGASNYNAVGVKNYPNLGVGVLQTAGGLNQSNTSAMRANIMTDGSYGDFVKATSQFYGSWGGGSINVAQDRAHTAAQTSLLEGDTSQAEIEGTAKALSPDPKVVQNLASIVPGVHPTGTGNDWLDLLMHGTGGPDAKIPAGTNIGSAIADAKSVVDRATDVTGVLQGIWSALTSRTNWVRIGILAGAVFLAFFGLYMVSRSFGGPNITEVIP